MDLQTDIGTEKGALDAQATQAAARQAALDKERVDVAARHDANMRPAEAALTATLDTPVPIRPQVEMPAPPKQVPVDPKEYEGLSYALLGIGLIAGVRSNKNWMGVSSTLNGAMKGYIEGKHEEADAAMKGYERQFKAAKDHEDQVNRQFDDVLNNRKLSINEQLQRIGVIAAQNNREDTLLEAKQRSIDGVIRSLDAHRTTLLGVEQRNDAVMARLQAAREHAARAGVGGKNGPATADGLELAAVLKEMGGSASMFGGQGPLYDRIAARELAKGRTVEQVAKDMLEGKIDIAAATSADRTATQRLQAVERLTTSVSTLEKRVTDLVARAGSGNVPTMNAAENWAKQHMGDGALQEMKTLMASVARQYVEAVTMPGSNAQMHAGAQELADSLLNPNQSPAQVAGTLRAMNAEIQATRSALHTQVKEAPAGVGERVAPTGGAQHPPDIDALVKKYVG